MGVCVFVYVLLICYNVEKHTVTIIKKISIYVWIKYCWEIPGEIRDLISSHEY